MRNELSRIGTALERYRDGERDRVAHPTAAYRSSVSSGSFALLNADVQDLVATVYALAEEAAERQRDLRVADRADGTDAEPRRELRRAFGRRNDELDAALRTPSRLSVSTNELERGARSRVQDPRTDA